MEDDSFTREIDNGGSLSLGLTVNALQDLRVKSLENLPHIEEHGVTVLWQPKDKSKIIADLVFVHGLGGHPRKTWQYRKAMSNVEACAAPQKSLLKRFFQRKQSEEASKTQAASEPSEAGSSETRHPDQSHKHCFWPIDLVPDEFDNVRVLTYGYDSHPSHFYFGRTNQMNISQHSQQLLQSISDARAECRSRPIIFVAHSLGGILVKDAVVLSGKYEYQPALKDLSLSCSAIIFFGTPHQGANAAAYGEMVGSIVGALPLFPSVYKEVLHGLKPDSEKLINVTTDFNDLLNRDVPADSKIQIYSFREGKPLTNLKKFDGKVVPDTSAFFNRRDIDQTSMIMADHLNMCKLKSAQDPGFVSFRAALSGYLNRIQSVTSHQQQEHQTGVLTALSEIIDFGARIQRQKQIASVLTNEATFEWVWSSDFSFWLKTEEPLFWISGKPASGKSTLMHHIFIAEKTFKLLSEAFRGEVTRVYHFFNFRAGDGIGNNFEGFLRSLLWQLIDKFPDSISSVPQLRSLLHVSPGSRMRRFQDFSIAELGDVLLRVLHCAPGRIFIGLDGLDEYGGEPVELVSFINRMTTANTKICLASRPDPPFPDAFANVPSFQMHQLNAPGIYKYARQTFDAVFMRKDWLDEDELHSLANQLTSQSRGVFLWARFATIEVVLGFSRGELVPCEDLVERIHDMPVELEDIYSRIIQKASPNDRALARVVLIFIAKAMDTVTTEMLQALLGLRSEFLQRWYQDVGHIALSCAELNSFKRRILASTGGLVEIYHEKKGLGAAHGLSNVELVHRTVKTFLDKRGWAELSVSSFIPDSEDGLWLHSCAVVIEQHTEYLGAQARLSLGEALEPFEYPWGALRHLEEETDVFESASSPQISNQMTIPTCMSVKTRLLLAYAMSYLPEHARLFELCQGASTFAMLSTIFSRSYVYLHCGLFDGMCACQRGRHRLRSEGMAQTSIQLAIGHSLTRFVEDYLEAEGEEASEPKSLDTSIGVSQPRSSLVNFYNSVVRNLFWCQPKKKEIVRHYAVRFAIDDAGTTILPTLRLALQHCPIVTDDELLEAITEASCEVIKVLLLLRPRGKLLLSVSEPERSKWIDNKNLINNEHLCPRKAFNAARLRPFWAIGKRGVYNAEAVIEIFSARGEDINEQCGPFGTVLHSYFDAKAGTSDYSNSEFLQLLLAKGADVNVQGPFGNTLEFLWMLANTSSHRKLRCVFPYTKMINDLIAAGAINNKKDPNGLVPSVERMRVFAKDRDDYAECKRFYKDGPAAPGSQPPSMALCELG